MNSFIIGAALSLMAFQTFAADVGRGYNSFTNTYLEYSCMEEDKESDELVNERAKEGLKVDYSLKRVDASSLESVAKKFNLGIGGIFQVFSIKNKDSLSKSYLFHLNLKFSRRRAQINPPTLKNSALALLDTGKFYEFFTICGDKYVSSGDEGLELNLIFNSTLDSLESLSEVNSELDLEIDKLVDAINAGTTTSGVEVVASKQLSKELRKYMKLKAKSSKKSKKKKMTKNLKTLFSISALPTEVRLSRRNTFTGGEGPLGQRTTESLEVHESAEAIARTSSLQLISDTTLAFTQSVSDLKKTVKDSFLKYIYEHEKYNFSILENNLSSYSPLYFHLKGEPNAIFSNLLLVEKQVRGISDLSTKLQRAVDSLAQSKSFLKKGKLSYAIELEHTLRKHIQELDYSFSSLILDRKDKFMVKMTDMLPSLEACVVRVSLNKKATEACRSLLK